MLFFNIELSSSATLPNERVKAACELANSTDEQVLVWCDYNAESELLKKNINGAVEVKGSDSDKHKVDAMLGFQTVIFVFLFLSRLYAVTV